MRPPPRRRLGERIGIKLGALTSLTRAVWALGFLVNVTFSDQMQHGSYDPLLPPGAPMDPNELTAMILDFCEAGIDAIIPTNLPTASTS